MLTLARWFVSLAALISMTAAELEVEGPPATPVAPVPARSEPRELSPAPLRPGPLQRWTLAKVMRTVEAEHPQIRSLQAERGALAARVLGARTSLPNPSVLVDSGTAEYTSRFGQAGALPGRRARAGAARAGLPGVPAGARGLPRGARGGRAGARRVRDRRLTAGAREVRRRPHSPRRTQRASRSY